MRKLLFVVACTGSSYALQAQITKGSVLLGGRLEYVTENLKSANSADEMKQRYVTISPAAGLAVKDNLLFGVDVHFQTSKTQNINNNTTVSQSSRSFGGGVFLRPYVVLGRNFYLFAEGRSGLTFFKEKYGNNAQYPQTKGYTIYLSIYPGISYAINRRFHVETGFSNMAYSNFRRSKSYSSAGEEVKRNSFNIGTSLNNPSLFTFAFRVLFAK